MLDELLSSEWQRTIKRIRRT